MIRVTANAIYGGQPGAGAYTAPLVRPSARMLAIEKSGAMGSSGGRRRLAVACRPRQAGCAVGPSPALPCHGRRSEAARAFRGTADAAGTLAERLLDLPVAAVDNRQASRRFRRCSPSGRSCSS